MLTSRNVRVGVQTTINSSIKLNDVVYHPNLLENLKAKSWKNHKVLFTKQEDSNSPEENHHSLPEGRNPGTLFQ